MRSDSMRKRCLISKKSITFVVDSEKVEKLDALASTRERDRSFLLNEGARRVLGSERLLQPYFFECQIHPSFFPCSQTADHTF